MEHNYKAIIAAIIAATTPFAKILQILSHCDRKNNCPDVRQSGGIYCRDPPLACVLVRRMHWALLGDNRVVLIGILRIYRNF